VSTLVNIDCEDTTESGHGSGHSDPIPAPQDGVRAEFRLC